jgi:branched-chain amino acid transport system permease protein
MRPRLAPLITAMGMSLLLQTVAMIIWKPNPKPFPICCRAIRSISAAR